MTQPDLAAAIGVTAQQVQKYEKGINRVSSGRLVAIAHHLQVALSVLTGTATGSRQEEVEALTAIPGAVALLRLYASLNSDERRSLIDFATAKTTPPALLRIGPPPAVPAA